MVSVVMPAYNEAEIIEDCVREWHREVVARIPGAELIVVDDSSTDQTRSVLSNLMGELPGLRAVRTPSNCGHGQALRLGFRSAQQPYVFQTDSDRQHLPEEFWKLWNSRAGFDFVFGVRETRADGRFRVFITTSMRLANLLLWGRWIRDANCPFKLMRSEPLSHLLASIPEDAFIPMVMVSILARKMGLSSSEVTVVHLRRQGGTQSLRGVLKWLRVGRTCLLQLVSLRMSIARNGFARLRPQPIASDPER